MRCTESNVPQGFVSTRPFAATTHQYHTMQTVHSIVTQRAYRLHQWRHCPALQPHIQWESPPIASEGCACFRVAAIRAEEGLQCSGWLCSEKATVYGPGFMRAGLIDQLYIMHESRWHDNWEQDPSDVPECIAELA